jgi:hypothetical protein
MCEKLWTLPSGMHILISVSSADPELPYDKTCVLDVGEHEFIKHQSYVAYEFAMQRHKNFIDDKQRRGVYIKHKDATSALISKICDGIKKSPFTKRAIKDGYDACVRATAKRQKAKANPKDVSDNSY